MDVYFVRHGETAYNRCHIHQSPTISLSERGREQARTVAEELRAMNPTLLLTSDYQRTQETARIIGSVLGLVPVSNALFHEVQRPSALYGISHYHPKTIRYVLGSVLKRNNPAWRMGDAENFSDIKKRIDAALNVLEAFGTEHQSIVVVSHTIFINLLTAYMCNSRTISLRILIPHLASIMRMENTEITHIKHTDNGLIGSCAWETVS